MSESLVRIGDVEPRYTATGRLSSFSIEVWHDGLKEHRELKSADPGVLENKLNALLVRWEEKWASTLTKLGLQASAESAASETAEAQAALAGCEHLLSHTLSVDDRVDWESLKSKAPFIWDGEKSGDIRYNPESNEPVAVVPVSRPKPPQRNEFQPDIKWFHHIIPGARQKLESAARARYMTARNTFDHEMAACDAIEKSISKKLAEQQTAFRQGAQAHLEAREAANAQVEEFRQNWHARKPDSILEHADLVLNASQYPAWLKMDYTLGYDDTAGILVVDYRLPAPAEVPTLERVSFVKSRNERVEKHISDSRRQKLFDSVCYQIALRTMHELFEADEADALSAVTFNGWVEAVNPATGREERNCILSVQAQKAEFLGFDLSRVDPKACFKALKGVAASSLAGLAPVRPVLQLQTDDPRFVPGRGIADALDESVNLAAMPWEDFEHLVRELFTKVFSSPGAEVHVTQASRDGGVDAVAFDPDPIKGGKIVIQAKRYTATVGVGAVRDLYGTVLNEGANRGILVTTSAYGPDAYRFAQGKPLTLLNGGNLLSLLSEHGHNARIDIAAARIQSS